MLILCLFFHFYCNSHFNSTLNAFVSLSTFIIIPTFMFRIRERNHPPFHPLPKNNAVLHICFGNFGALIKQKYYQETHIKSLRAGHSHRCPVFP